jgi:DNA-binding transcriptional LysR family regulator
LLVRSHCEQAEELSGLLRAKNIAPVSCHRVASEADFAALLAAGLGIAVTPGSAALPDNASRLELSELQLTRTVTAYGVAGRPRSPAASMLLKLLRAADWSHVAGPSYRGALSRPTEAG